MHGFAFRMQQLLQTGALADSTELWHTEDKFVLNEFPSHCDWCFYIRGKK